MHPAVFVHDAAGRYVYPYAPPGLDLPREFDELCGVLKDPPELRRRVGDAYRELFKGNVYYIPLIFLREFHRGGSNRLKSFLWWLASLRRPPKRRLLAHGAAGWVRHLLARLTPSRSRGPS